MHAYWERIENLSGRVWIWRNRLDQTGLPYAITVSDHGSLPKPSVGQFPTLRKARQAAWALFNKVRRKWF